MGNDVGERLLDAQVDWVLGELSGKRLAKVVERDVDDLLALAETIEVHRLVDFGRRKTRQHLVEEQQARLRGQRTRKLEELRLVQIERRRQDLAARAEMREIEPLRSGCPRGTRTMRFHW